MARPWSRKGRHEHTPAPPKDPGNADLGADEHAWWAQRDLQDLWAPRASDDTDDSHDAAPPEPERDVLAEHFGDDWRTTFGFDPPPEPPDPEPPAPEPEPPPVEPVDTSDPYAVLDVEPTATWEEIVRAHRAMARRHHPDRFGGRSDHEVAAAEERIRAINVAYQELRIRRGR